MEKTANIQPDPQAKPNTTTGLNSQAQIPGNQQLSAKTEPPKRSFVQFNPGPINLTTSIPGVKLDFNYGVRIQVPEGNYHVRFIDKDTSTILYDAPISGAIATSTKNTTLISG
jgi:hypothetical protein